MIDFFNDIFGSWYFQNKKLRIILIVGILFLIFVVGIRACQESECNRSYNAAILLLQDGEFKLAKQNFEKCLEGNYRVKESKLYLDQIAKQDSLLSTLFVRLKREFQKNYNFFQAKALLRQLNDTCDSQGYYLQFKDFIKLQQLEYIQNLINQRNFVLARSALNNFIVMNNEAGEDNYEHNLKLYKTLQNGEIQYIQNVAKQQQFGYANQLAYNYLGYYKDTSGFREIINFVQTYQREIALAAAAAAASAAGNNYFYQTDQTEYSSNYRSYGKRSYSSSSKGKRGKRRRR
ncbi:MAG: hypothetical protein RML72_06200 [Bacteroidia bacterium]|nr:hypothetical protein [Bacteroidia bacterium]MDW8158451.1 hypothetical protein [Bacteroidia bacterium]